MDTFFIQSEAERRLYNFTNMIYETIKPIAKMLSAFIVRLKLSYIYVKSSDPK